MKLKEIKSNKPTEKVEENLPTKRDLRAIRERRELLRQQLNAENTAETEVKKRKRGRPPKKKEEPKTSTSNRKGEKREVQNELTAVLVCSRCRAPYVHSITNETNKEKEKSAYVCSVHNKGCEKKNPQRKLDADYLEFMMRASLLIAIKIGDPIGIYFKNKIASDITSIEEKLRGYETDCLTIESFIKAEPSVRRFIYMMALINGSAYIDDEIHLRKAESVRISFSNRIMFSVELYPPNKHSLTDMNFYVYERNEGTITAKDGRTLKVFQSKKLLESGIFHTDHTISFTHHTDESSRFQKPISYEGFSADYWNKLADEIALYIKDAEKATDEFKKQHKADSEEKEKLIEAITKKLKGMKLSPKVSVINKCSVEELKMIKDQIKRIAKSPILDKRKRQKIVNALVAELQNTTTKPSFNYDFFEELKRISKKFRENGNYRKNIEVRERLINKLVDRLNRGEYSLEEINTDSVYVKEYFKSFYLEKYIRY